MEENSSTENQTPITESTSKRNDWKILSGILAIVVIALLVYMFLGKGITGNVISEKDANTKVLEYLNSRAGGGVESVSTKDLGNLYEVTVSYQGNNIPVYVTKDGKYFVQGAVPMTGAASQTSCKTDADCAADETCKNGTCVSKPVEVPKSDKPVVEAFVFSYCPYGLQFEKALQPVYDLLKNKADIKIVAIGAMHGEFEKTETLRQICIEKNYGKDKLWSYLKDFMVSSEISACNGADACVNPLVEKIMTSKGIDKTKINNCMKTDAEALYEEENARAQELGISGSPTFVINGAKVNVGRNAETIKKAICDAFNTAPSECSKTLSTTSTSAGFGATTAGSVASASSGAGSAASCG